MTQFTLRLAGVDFQFHSLTVELSSKIQPTYGLFVGSWPNSKAAGTYEILPPDGNLNARLDPSELVWDCLTWRMGRVNGNQWCCEINKVADNSWLPVALFADDFSSGRIVQRGGRMAAPSPYCLNYPIDQVLLINRLAYKSAGVLHASGILLDGKVYLLCGRSGVGKTTLARLCRAAGAKLLNDDRMIVRMVDGQPMASATPWHGEDPEVNKDIAPLGGIFHLNQAAENHVSALDPVRGVMRMLATSVAPFYSRTTSELLMGTWAEVMETVPSYELDFTPDPRAVALIRSTVDQRVRP